MDLALDAAKQALLITSPNPRVGCVLVADDGSVIGQGHTQRAGGPRGAWLRGLLSVRAAGGRRARDLHLRNRNEKEASQQMLHDVAYYLAYEFVIMVNGAIPTEAEMKAITNSINNVISVGANIEKTKEKCLEKEAGKTLETQEEINTSCY